MQGDRFGIVGRNHVLPYSELVAGLRDARAAWLGARHENPDAVVPDGTTAQGSVEPLDVFDACRRLVEQGAQVVLLPAPGHQHLLPLLVDEVGVPVIGLPPPLPDASTGTPRVAGDDGFQDDHIDRLLADRAASLARRGPRKVFRLGVVGGVGPAATVDFLNKVVRGTDAARDQDHLKILLEQNPQIPDRTAFLLDRGADPAVALYATCKRLERQGASAIAIPCNTAHVFLPRIAHRLHVPIVDMIAETLDCIVRQHGSDVHIGLLATSGTVNSGVYAAAAKQRGLTLLVPSNAAQLKVMNAIYGPLGIKAGYTQGGCETDLQSAINELARIGARALILGCTELPMVVQGHTRDAQGIRMALVDPTEVLARRCIALSLGTP
ncbi:aspartate/glutamate racemase family protein [Pigmentiphaga litoralis]|uniref:Aspartate racemase n=1 Tax=Pigmentiphaga litoralis TaxID=516702 RepID=A0A7Y9IYN2_9BURK|nr:amino acid racemase [Pigmentiphaga litoralis]NYE26105.1 aspartate racemase [Pigmentiphaga litoralis]NYE85225.1 aspartate racemase [Pigmentiphaga litoralis]